MTRPALAVLAALLAGCATPAAPSGGPVDATPPALVSSDPADGATGVVGRTVTLTFSEPVDPAARTAVAVTPSAAAPEVEVDGSRLRVTLPALRDSTTYVLTVGTALKDRRGVALTAPITLAFATGDRIDRARIAGVVQDPETGAGARLAVWAYALADSAAAPAPDRAPDYQTETDAGGAFALEYLRPGPYAVVAVADGNRNRRADGAERFAVAPRPVLRADTAAGVPVTLWATQAPVAAEALRVRPASARRFAVRFDRAVRLTDPAGAGWALSDSATGRPVPFTLYQPPDAPYEVTVEAGGPLAPVPHRVSFQPGPTPSLADSAGTAPAPFALVFTPSAAPDTVRARFVGFLQGARADSVVVLRPGDPPRLRFSAPPADPAAVIVLSAGGGPLAVPLASADGVTITPVLGDLRGQFTVTVARPDTVASRVFSVAGERETGGVTGRVTADGPVVVEVRTRGEAPVQVRAGADGAFTVGGLLPGAYTVRAWADLDGDGRWSGGSWAPYRAPEPLVLLPDPVQVRARWETEVGPVTL